MTEKPTNYIIFYDYRSGFDTSGWFFKSPDGNFVDGPYFNEADAVDGAWKHKQQGELT